MLVLFPVACAMLSAVIMAAMAGYENFRFARGLEQYLNLISVARHYADVQPGFAQQPGEDILAMLGRNGQIAAQVDSSGGRIANPWGSDMRASVTQASVLRIDAVVPVHACRRLGAYFTKIARDFAMTEFATQIGNAAPHAIYNGAASRTVSETEIDQICGTSSDVTVSMTFRLR